MRVERMIGIGERKKEERKDRIREKGKPLLFLFKVTTHTHTHTAVRAGREEGSLQELRVSVREVGGWMGRRDKS